MKTVIAACVVVLGVFSAGVSAAPAQPSQWINGISATSSISKDTLQVANRKGSKRVGGTNSKGKRSKYVGGRKR